MKLMLNKIKQKLTLFVNFILLTIVYFFGIGLTFLLAKIFNKNFLSIKNGKKQSNFTIFKETNGLERMF